MGAGKQPKKAGRVNESFFDRPILNSPYAFPGRHWELDADG
jgi:type III restriction enzyme